MNGLNKKKMEITKQNINLFNEWAEKSGRDLTNKIKNCKYLSEKEICYEVLNYITSELKEPEKFYNFIIDLSTAVADEYFWRWETSVGKHDKWSIYEEWIGRVTAKAMQEMIPELINGFVCCIDEGSVLIENILKRYNRIVYEKESNENI